MVTRHEAMRCAHEWLQTLAGAQAGLACCLSGAGFPAWWLLLHAMFHSATMILLVACAVPCITSAFNPLQRELDLQGRRRFIGGYGNCSGSCG